MKGIIDIKNGQITFDYPDDFNLLTYEEAVEKAENKVKPENWVVTNKEKHVMYNVAWKKIPFLAKSLSQERVRNNSKRNMKKIAKNFKDLGDVETVIGNKKALGFRFEYFIQGVEQKVEYVLFTYEDHYVSFIYTSLPDTFDENYPIYRQVLDTVEFK